MVLILSYVSKSLFLWIVVTEAIHKTGWKTLSLEQLDAMTKYHMCWSSIQL